MIAAILPSWQYSKDVDTTGNVDGTGVVGLHNRGTTAGLVLVVYNVKMPDQITDRTGTIRLEPGQVAMAPVGGFKTILSTSTVTDLEGLY